MSLLCTAPAMLPAMQRPSIAIVGAGRLGSALATSLGSAGYSIREVVSRDNRLSLAVAQQLARRLGTRAWTAGAAPIRADLIWFCVPDSEVSKAAIQLSDKDWKGRAAFHSSGVLPSDALEVLREKGTAVASVHPLMTFVRGSVPELRGVTFAIETRLHITHSQRSSARCWFLCSRLLKRLLRWQEYLRRPVAACCRSSGKRWRTMRN